MVPGLPMSWEASVLCTLFRTLSRQIGARSQVSFVTNILRPLGPTEISGHPRAEIFNQVFSAPRVERDGTPVRHHQKPVIRGEARGSALQLNGD